MNMVLRGCQAAAGCSMGRVGLNMLDEMMRKAVDDRLSRMPADERDAREVLSGNEGRLKRLVPQIALRLGIEPCQARSIGAAAVWHDVGKLDIPSPILLKRGGLDPDERTVMDTHTLLGVKFIERTIAATPRDRRPPMDLLAMLVEIARGHHEGFSGTGYPDRVHGWRIPLPARIVSVADVYDALVTDRPYKAAWSHDRAVAHIASLRGEQFDPDVVDAFMEVVNVDRSYFVSPAAAGFVNNVGIKAS